MRTKKYKTRKDLEKIFGRLTFGGALESERLCQDMSQKDFAKKLGITPQSLCDIEKGRRIPSVKRAAEIARALEDLEAGWISLALSDMVHAVRKDLEVHVKIRAS